MPMDYDEGEQIPSPLPTLWQENYPFDYWHNRILKINPYNPQDKLEAVFVLLQLADTYATVLSAKLRNPYAPWYMIVEELPTREIHQTLERLSVSTEQDEYIDLCVLEEGEQEVLIGYNIKDDWEGSISVFELLAADLLGCPARIDTDAKSIEFAEDPEDYVAVCNGLVNFWKGHTAILNDLKHGFRLLPFDMETLEQLLEMGLLRVSEIDLDTKISEYQETKEEYLYFWRLEIDELPDREKFKKEGDVKMGMRLVVYRTKAMRCRDLAYIALQLLDNLFGRGGDNEVVESMHSLTEEDSDSIRMFETFLSGELFYGENGSDD